MMLKYAKVLLVMVFMQIVCLGNTGIKVSIIIPCHSKHAIYLPELLQAYASQTVLPDEVVIAVSESELMPDALLKVLQNSKWPFPIKYVLSKEKAFAGENRNKACAIATGDLFVCQDADDLPTTNRIEVIKYFFNTHEIDHLMHLFNFSFDLKRTHLKDIEFIYPKSYEDSWNRVKKFHNGNIAIKKEVFDKIQWSSQQKGQDVEFNNKVYKEFKCIIILIPLVIYRLEYSSWKSFLLF